MVIRLMTAWFLLMVSPSFCQTNEHLLSLVDADSNYVRKFKLKNDLRLFYGGQGNNLSLGSTRDDGIEINSDLYKNTNDYIGVGITYGLLDGDISFSLPGTTYLKEERSNLTQLKLAFSYTRRKIVYRWYYHESTGVIISDSENAFESSPSIHEMKLGMQITYLFNPSQYSYRAAMYQTECQMKTAGSFLLRFDPFYRQLGTSGGSMVPAAYDLESRFGEQTGLEYIGSPGLLVLAGYGMNIVIRNTPFFISPIAFAGFGVAQNKFRATSGTDSFTSLEYAAHFILNAGYNHARYYTKLQVNWSSGYTSLDPTYLTHSNLTCLLMVGWRFRNLK